MSGMRDRAASSSATIQVHSDRFGEFVVPAEQILSFPEGLIGFPDFTRFVVMDHRTPSLLRWLLCVDEPNLAFAIVDPSDFFQGYSVAGHEELATLGLSGTADLAVFSIVTVPSDPAAMSANLMAPVVVNIRTRVAKQIILDESQYSTRHLLLSPPVDG